MLPKAVAEFKRMLEEKNLPVNAGSIGMKEFAHQRNKANSAMKHALNVSNKTKAEEHKRLSKGTHRHEWMAEYMLEAQPREAVRSPAP